MDAQVRSFLLGTAGLDVAVVAAVVLTLARGGVAASEARLHAAVRLAGAAVLVQAAHFAEELVTGFHRRFPELLGLAPWPAGFFAAFNLAWLALWCLSLRGLSSRRHAALFPLWFLGLAGAANGLAHPWFSIRTGGYFPGLLSAPLAGAAGVWLLRELARITGTPEPAPGPAAKGAAAGPAGAAGGQR